MKNSNQELTINFNKTQLKDLLIHKIASHMQQHWNADDVITLFLSSPFNFVEGDKTKAQVVSTLMETHQAALKNEFNFVA
jgi:hypothetical protein